MTNEEFIVRAACERAGIQIREIGISASIPFAVVPVPGAVGVQVVHLPLDPACDLLLAYAASRLVAMVRERGELEYLRDALVGSWQKVAYREIEDALVGATDEQRIRACLEVLRD